MFPNRYKKSPRVNFRRVTLFMFDENVKGDIALGIDNMSLGDLVSRQSQVSFGRICFASLFLINLFEYQRAHDGSKGNVNYRAYKRND